MAITIMPVNRGSPNFAIRVILDEVPFRIDFRVNIRDGFWYFDIKDDQGTQLRSGVKVTSDFPLLVRMVSRPRPSGSMLVIPRNPNVHDADIGNFGTDAPLYYVEQETLIEELF